MTICSIDILKSKLKLYHSVSDKNPRRWRLSADKGRHNKIYIFFTVCCAFKYFTFFTFIYVTDGGALVCLAINGVVVYGGCV